MYGEEVVVGGRDVPNYRQRRRQSQSDSPKKVEEGLTWRGGGEMIGGHSDFAVIDRLSLNSLALSSNSLSAKRK